MFHELFPHFFEEEELQVLQAAKGRRLQMVLYTIWKNVAKANDEIQVLEWVEIFFEEGGRLSITAGEDSDGIKIQPFDFDEESELVKSQFNGQVELERVDMSYATIWKPAIGKALSAIGLAFDPDNRAPNHTLQLEFEDHTLLFGLDREGLIVKDLPTTPN